MLNVKIDLNWFSVSKEDAKMVIGPTNDDRQKQILVGHLSYSDDLNFVTTITIHIFFSKTVLCLIMS